MPSRKVTEMESATTPVGLNVLYVIVDTLGTPTGKQISLDTLFGHVPSNTNIIANFNVQGQTTLSNTTVAKMAVTGPTTLGQTTVASNGIVISTKLTPANSSVSSISAGKFFYDDNYLYIKTSNTVIKRVSLSTF
jgi:hypothetical protein